MKKLILLLAVMLGISTASARDTFTRDANVLPAAAQTIIKNYFKADVNHIKIDKDWGRISEYDVVLNDGTEITFDRNGNWKDIEVQRNASVPAGLIPAAITSYIKQNQKNTTIVGIEKKSSGYEVELSNGVDMIFNSKGEFKRYER